LSSIDLLTLTLTSLVCLSAKSLLNSLRVQACPVGIGSSANASYGVPTSLALRLLLLSLLLLNLLLLSLLLLGATALELHVASWLLIVASAPASRLLKTLVSHLLLDAAARSSLGLASSVGLTSTTSVAHSFSALILESSAYINHTSLG
jgi:hypothetical protein